MPSLEKVLASGRSEKKPRVSLEDVLKAAREESREPIGKTNAAIQKFGEAIPFTKQVAAGIGAVAGEAAEGLASLGVPGPEGIAEAYGGQEATLGERYASVRDEIDARQVQAGEEEPVAAALGTGASILTQIASTGGASALRSIPGALRQGGRALLTREGAKAAIPGAAKALASRETAKAAAGGAAYGIAAEASEGEGDYSTAALQGAAGGVVGRAVLGAGAAAVEARTVKAAEKAIAVTDLAEFNRAVATLPEERIRVQEANALEVARVKAANKAAKEAAALQNEARTAVAGRAARAKQLENPMVRTGLEGKQSKYASSLEAQSRAEALVREPMPGRPDLKLVDVADELSPTDRMKFAVGMRQEQGRILGEIRDELAERGSQTSTFDVRQAIQASFDDLPTEVRKNAQKKIKGLVGSVSQGGKLSPAAIRKLIEDFEILGKVGSPKIDSALGKARTPVFRKARAVLVAREREMVAEALPDRAGEYVEGLRRYGVYSDLELGSDVFIKRAQKGKPIIPEPKVKIEKVTPELQEAALLRTPRQPEFPGGEEALQRARGYLEPSRMGKVGRSVLQSAVPGLGALVGASAGGGAGAVVGSSVGAPIGQKLGNVWQRWLTPTTASLMQVNSKLKAVAPMMEEAMRRGPQAVAILHVQLMQANGYYRSLFDESSP